MAKRRYISYGYHLKDGDISINEMEAETINMIFDLYLEGNSYLSISRILNSTNTRYSKAAVWNKNNVGRILKNTKYIGDENFAAIITTEKFDAVQSIAANNDKLKNKAFTEHENHMKELVCCSNCQSRLNSRYGEWVCTNCDSPASIKHIDLNERLIKIFNQLAEDVELIDVPEFRPFSPDIKVKRLENELYRQYDGIDGERNESIESILELADMRYRLCDDGSNGRNGEKIKDVLRNSKPSEQLDIELIKNITNKIIVQPDGGFYILLKNGQEIK